MVVRLFALFGSTSHSALHFHPTSLTMTEVTLLVWLFFLKAILKGLEVLIVGSGKDPRAEKERLLKMTQGSRLDISLSMPLKILERDIDAYTKATGCSKEDLEDSKAQKLLFLSAITTPAMLLILAKRGCPIQPLGAVNVRNKFTLLRPDLCSISYLETVTDGVVIAKLSRPPALANRGLEYSFEVEVHIPEKGSTIDLIVASRMVFTMLQFERIPRSLVPPDAASRQLEFQFPKRSGTVGDLRLMAGDPSKWAQLCKDYNPIHIWDSMARMYGFPGKIAHGNHAVAIALAKLEEGMVTSSLEAPCEVEVSFKRPIVVPTKLDLFFHEPDDEPVAHFGIGRPDKKYILGTFKEIV